MRRILEIVIAAACCALAAGQPFEVASINTRMDGTGDIYTLKPFRFDLSGPRIMIENFRLRDLVQYAYDITRWNIAQSRGGPPDDASLTR